MLKCGSRLRHLRSSLYKHAASLNTSYKRYASTKEVPTSAEVVIAGGGAIGTSIAYHLTQLGWKDIVLLEQGSLGCGTSWHAAGLVGTARKSYEATQLGRYAIELFTELDEEYGLGFKNCGSLIVAQTDDRALTLKHSYNNIKEWGIESHLLSPKEAGELNPLINTSDIKIGLSVPMDGVVNPTDVVQAYSKGATKHGATKIYEGIEIKEVKTEGRRVTAVNTNEGNIKCDIFINAAGLWANQLGTRSTPVVGIPLQPCQHFYVVTKPMDVDSMMPVTRDHDAHLYIREWSGGLMAGGFEPHALPCFYDGIPEKFEFQLLEENWDQFGFLMDGILNRFPCVNNAEIRNFTNGPESFTPDGNPNVSFSKELDNYMMACGMNSNGIVGSPGYGRMVAELLTYGESPYWNPNYFDIRRFPPGANNRFFQRASGPVVLTTRYALVHPQSTYKETCRNIMNSPVHDLLTSRGAVWNQQNNWEVPSYFLESGQTRASPTFGKPDWLRNVQKEMKACNEAVGLVDLSSDCIFQIEGGCENDLKEFENMLGIRSYDDNVALKNQNGGCIALANISALNKTSIVVQSQACVHNFLSSWLQTNASRVNGISVRDVTGNYGIFKIMGPNADLLLDELLSPPYKMAAYEEWKDKVVDVGYACDVIISSSSLGPTNKSWNLTVPVKYSQGLFRLLLSHGEKYELCNVGHIAMESLRVHQMLPTIPNEIGLRTKDEVVDKILKSTDSDKKPPGSPLLCKLRIDITNSKNWLWGGELIYSESSTEQSKIASISSIGYSENEDDVLYALSLIQSDSSIGDGVVVKTGLDVYSGKISDKL